MPAHDPFESFSASPHSAPTGGYAIAPSDVEQLPRVIRFIMVKTAGDVCVEMKDGDVVTLPALQPGVQYLANAIAVRAAGTDAGGIVGLV